MHSLVLISAFVIATGRSRRNLDENGLLVISFPISRQILTGRDLQPFRSKIPPIRKEEKKCRKFDLKSHVGINAQIKFRSKPVLADK